MKVMHDVWVNWTYGGDKKKYIPEYFEWRADDNIESFTMFPVIRVSKEDYERMAFGYDELPHELLEYLEGKAQSGKGRDKAESDYSVIISDGENVLAICTERHKEPLLKSKLIPRQDEQVRSLVKDIPIFKLEWKNTRKEPDSGEGILGKIIDIRPEYMTGLTRKERELKEILFDCLFELSCSDNIQEIKYWYIELFPEMYGTKALETLQREEFLDLIFEEVRFGWSDIHMQFGNNLVKFYDLFEDMWNDIKKRDEVKKTKGKEKETRR